MADDSELLYYVKQGRIHARDARTREETGGAGDRFSDCFSDAGGWSPHRSLLILRSANEKPTFAIEKAALTVFNLGQAAAHEI
jgi:hypothetical protein